MIFAEVCLTFCPRSLNYYQLLGTNPPTPIVYLQCVSILKENTWLSWTRVGQLVRLLDNMTEDFSPTALVVAERLSELLG